MWLVVGLGNPGTQYQGTRHNVGFEVIDYLAHHHPFETARRFKKAEVRRGAIDGHAALLAKPQTFMNLSGDAVGALARYYKIEPAAVVVVHDELDYSPGEVRLKSGGGPGGHNGLRSIIAHLGREFVRVRVGVGKPPSSRRGADFVLSRFDKRARQQIDDAVMLAAEAVERTVGEGLSKAMNRINQRKPGGDVPAPAAGGDPKKRGELE